MLSIAKAGDENTYPSPNSPQVPSPNQPSQNPNKSANDSKPSTPQESFTNGDETNNFFYENRHLIFFVGIVIVFVLFYSQNDEEETPDKALFSHKGKTISHETNECY